MTFKLQPSSTYCTVVSDIQIFLCFSRVLTEDGGAGDGDRSAAARVRDEPRQQENYLHLAHQGPCNMPEMLHLVLSLELAASACWLLLKIDWFPEETIQPSI